MIPPCAHCGAAPNYLQAGFDRYQCMACGGFTTMTGQPTVPTSALAHDSNYDGPGAELIPDPNHPEITREVDPSVQIATPSAPRPVVTGGPDTGNPTPGGETPEGTAPQPVQVADGEAPPAPAPEQPAPTQEVPSGEAQ